MSGTATNETPPYYYYYYYYYGGVSFVSGSGLMLTGGPVMCYTQGVGIARKGEGGGGRVRPQNRAFPFPCRAQGRWIFDSVLRSMGFLMVSQC